MMGTARTDRAVQTAVAANAEKGGTERYGSDDRGFERFVIAEISPLVATAAMIVGNRAVAEEIVGEVLERTYLRWAKVSAMDRPGAWARRAVINRSVSLTRRRSSERKAMDLLRRRRPPQVAVEENAESACLWAAVRELPKDQAISVALRYGADLSVAGVAAEMNMTEAATRTLLYRARVALRSNDQIKEVQP